MQVTHSSLHPMPPFHHNHSLHTTNAYSNSLSLVTQLHGGTLPSRHARHQPYIVPISTHDTIHSHRHVDLPPTLCSQINTVQAAAMMETTQKKDASRLREFLSFCAGLGIHATHSLQQKTFF